MARNHPVSLLSQRFIMLVALLLLLAGQTAVSTHATTTATSPNIVISQIYGGGGNAGATYTHDFIELFNLGSSDVDITGWSVQYTSASGTAWQTTPLAGTIAPGQYYLVQEAQGAGGTTPLPTPDASGSLNLSATSGKISLVSNATPLTGSCPLADAVDFVGYGSPNCAEGSAAPTLSNTLAAQRGSDGCNETDSNAADFASGAPNPRNSSSPTNVCTPPSDDAPTVTATTPGNGDTNITVSSNITITFSEAVTVGSSWFNITCSSSGSHTAASSGGPTSYTLNPGSDFDPGESCTVTVIASEISDNDTTDPPDTMPADYMFSFTTAVSNTWIINEIHADPDANEGDANNDGTAHPGQDEFVEIVNNSGSSADISGWTVSDAVGIKHTFPSGTIIADQCAVLLFSGGTPTGSFGGAVVQTAVSPLALNNGPETVTLHDGSAIRATVSYGSEGADNQSLTRDPDLSGAFVKHSLASGSGGTLFSPGTRLDGTPFSGCSAPADNAPTVTATTPTDGATNVAVNANLTITFSESVDVTGSWAAVSCSSSGSHTVATSGSGSSRTLNPSPDFAPGESCTVTIDKDLVSDSDSDDPPDTMTADYVFDFTTAVSTPTHILLNEVDSDTPGTDTAEFIELYDGGSGNTNLTGLVVVLFNGST
ncbi:MAG: lamin tail domain-containing protein, partial [Anaerolineales bacterium]|nr:lamin tail domain-containing protein [Anaerolineales bacterium]